MWAIAAFAPSEGAARWVACLHGVEGEMVRQDALVGGEGAALVASLAGPYKGVAVRRLYRGVGPPALLCGEPGVEHAPCAELYASGAERAVGAVEPDQVRERRPLKRAL